MDVNKKYFSVNINKYSDKYDYCLFRASSLDNPRNNAVSFITKANIHHWDSFMLCSECLIFWPQECDVPTELYKNDHVVLITDNPHLRYCQFFEENRITNLPPLYDVELVNGVFISKRAIIGKNCTIFPGAFIGDEVVIGDECYISSGVKIIGDVHVGNRVIIRENTVIGADGLTTDIDKDGRCIKMPQFGGVIIEDDVLIGANTVIARGAIDDTIIEKEASIDNSVFISHNVHIGKRTFIVGETIMFGSSSLGNGSFISGNSTIRNGIVIGEKCLIGMGSVVTKNVSDGETVKGNPAK